MVFRGGRIALRAGPKAWTYMISQADCNENFSHFKKGRESWGGGKRKAWYEGGAAKQICSGQTLTHEQRHLSYWGRESLGRPGELMRA